MANRVRDHKAEKYEAAGGVEGGGVSDYVAGFEAQGYGLGFRV